MHKPGVCHQLFPALRRRQFAHRARREERGLVFQMNDEQRSAVCNLARPFGLRLKSPQLALQPLIREWPLSSGCALPGAISDSNAIGGNN